MLPHHTLCLMICQLTAMFAQSTSLTSHPPSALLSSLGATLLVEERAMLVGARASEIAPFPSVPTQEKLWVWKTCRKVPEHLLYARHLEKSSVCSGCFYSISTTPRAPVNSNAPRVGTRAQEGILRCCFLMRFGRHKVQSLVD